MNCYTIRDDAAGYFLPPYFAVNDAVAQRLMISSMGDSFAHRHQFNLYKLGHFDDDEGILTALETPEHILSGHSISETLDPRPSVYGVGTTDTETGQ